MKKTILFIFSMLLISSSVFASARKPPENTYAGCLAQIEDQAKKEGVINPWFGGNRARWDAYANPKYNSCTCKYLKKPWPYGNFTCGN